MLPIRHVVLLSGFALVAAACTPAAAESGLPSRPKGAATTPTATKAPQMLTLGEVTYADQGTLNVEGKEKKSLVMTEAGFAPTFVRGAPGQQFTLKLRNRGSIVHNFSLPAQNVDVDVPTGGDKVEVDVTFPDSGALLFFCKYHAAQGMNGQLLTGLDKPQPLPAPALLAPSPAVPSPSPSPSAR